MLEPTKRRQSYFFILVLFAGLCFSLASGCQTKLTSVDEAARRQVLERKARRFPLLKTSVKKIGLAELSVFSREPYTNAASWSPDGKLVAYVVSKINKQQGDLKPSLSVYVSDITGGNAVLVADHAYAPSWSPDGRKLVFVSYSAEEPEKEAIWISNADGTDKKQLCSEGSFSPVWSPDGRKVAFLRKEAASAAASLWIARVESTSEAKVASNVSRDRVSWFPDSETLAFISEDEDPHQLATVDIDGKNFKKLTDVLSVCSQPAVSPDGQKILFIQVREEGYEGPDIGEVYSIAARGGTPEVALAGRSWQGPAWSPDGNRFVCGGQAVAIVDYKSKAYITLGAETGICWNPVWSPNGTEIFGYVPESEWGGKVYRLKLKPEAETYPLFLVICGSFTAAYPEAYNLASALRTQVNFLPPGFPEIIDSDVHADLTPGYSMVLGGRFASQEEADNLAAQLKSAGFSPSVRKIFTSDMDFYLPAGAIIKRMVYTDLDSDKKNEIVIAYVLTNGVEWQGYLTVFDRQGEGFNKTWEQSFPSAGFDNYANLIVDDINGDGLIEIAVHWIYSDGLEKFYIYRSQSEGILLLQAFESDQGLSYRMADGKLEIRTSTKTGRRYRKILIETWRWTNDRFEVVFSETIVL